MSAPAFEESMVFGEWNVERELYPDIVQPGAFYHSYSSLEEQKKQQQQHQQERRSSLSSSVTTSQPHNTRRPSGTFMNSHNKSKTRAATSTDPLDQSTSSAHTTRWTGANDKAADPLEDLDKSSSKYSVGHTFMYSEQQAASPSNKAKRRTSFQRRRTSSTQRRRSQTPSVTSNSISDNSNNNSNNNVTTTTTLSKKEKKQKFIVPMMLSIQHILSWGPSRDASTLASNNQEDPLSKSLSGTSKAKKDRQRSSSVGPANKDRHSSPGNATLKHRMSQKMQLGSYNKATPSVLEPHHQVQRRNTIVTGNSSKAGAYDRTPIDIPTSIQLSLEEKDAKNKNDPQQAMSMSSTQGGSIRSRHSSKSSAKNNSSARDLGMSRPFKTPAAVQTEPFWTPQFPIQEGGVSTEEAHRPFYNLQQAFQKPSPPSKQQQQQQQQQHQKKQEPPKPLPYSTERLDDLSSLTTPSTTTGTGAVEEVRSLFYPTEEEMTQDLTADEETLFLTPHARNANHVKLDGLDMLSLGSVTNYETLPLDFWEKKLQVSGLKEERAAIRIIMSLGMDERETRLRTQLMEKDGEDEEDDAAVTLQNQEYGETVVHHSLIRQNEYNSSSQQDNNKSTLIMEGTDPYGLRLGYPPPNHHMLQGFPGDDVGEDGQILQTALNQRWAVDIPPEYTGPSLVEQKGALLLRDCTKVPFYTNPHERRYVHATEMAIQLRKVGLVLQHRRFDHAIFMVKDMILHHREELKRQAAESNNEEDDEIKDDFTIGSLLHNIGNICMFQGDYRRSRRYFREALAVRAKSSNERDSDIVVTLSKIGVAHFATGNFEEAGSAFLKCVDIQRQLPKTNTADLGELSKLYNNLGCVVFFMGGHSTGIKWFKKSIGLCKSDEIKKDNVSIGVNTATALLNISVLHAARGEGGKAMVTVLEACPTQQKVLGVTHPMVLPFVESLAFLCTRSDFTEKALFVYETMLKIHKEMYGVTDETTIRTLAKLIHVQIIVHDYKGATENIKILLQIQDGSLPSNDPRLQATNTAHLLMGRTMAKQ